MNRATFLRLVCGLAAMGLLTVTVLVFLASAEPTARAASDTLFASPTRSGSACTQASPCSTGTALAQAFSGDTVYLAQGIYIDTGEAVIILTKSLTLYGGWDDSPSGAIERGPDANPTTIDAEGQRRGVIVGSGLTVALDGITVTNGVAAGNGAGLYSRDAGLMLRETTFYSNVIDLFDGPAMPYAYGGGAYIEGGTLLVTDSRFEANSVWAKSSASGGGLAISTTVTATVEGCLFQDTDAWHAGGIYFLGPAGERAPVTVASSRFVDNGVGNGVGRAMGGYAGAVEIVRAQATPADSTFSGSSAGYDIAPSRHSRPSF